MDSELHHDIKYILAYNEISAFFAKFKKAHSRQKCGQLWTLQMISNTGKQESDNFYKPP